MSESTSKTYQHGFPGSFTTLRRDYDSHGNMTEGSTVVDTGKRATDFTSGVKLPNYKSLLRARSNATTLFSGEKFSGAPDFLQASYTARNSQTGASFFSELFGVPGVASYPGAAIVPGDVQTEVFNRALRKFLQKANSVRSSIEAGQDLGELKQSIEAILNPMGSLRKHVLGYFSSVKKLKNKYKHVPSLKKALSDTYLEWTFGWKPLASDIAEGIVGLQNANRVLPSYPVSGSASAPSDGSHLNTSAGDSNGSVTIISQNTSVYQVRFKGSMNTRSVNNSIPYGQILQLELPDFLPTAWDLLPYSFIADYFVNIGDIITAVSFRSSDLSWVCQTTRSISRRIYRTVSYEVALPFPQFVWSISGKEFGGGNFTLTRVAFQRSSPSPSSLIPSLTFSLPVSKKPWLNLGAIMASHSKSVTPLW